MIEVLKVVTKTTNKPAAITEPGIAYPEEEINIMGLSFLVPLWLKESEVAKKTVTIAAHIPIISEL